MSDFWKYSEEILSKVIIEKKDQAAADLCQTHQRELSTKGNTKIFHQKGINISITSTQCLSSCSALDFLANIKKFWIYKCSDLVESLNSSILQCNYITSYMVYIVLYSSNSYSYNVLSSHVTCLDLTAYYLNRVHVKS